MQSHIPLAQVGHVDATLIHRRGASSWTNEGLRHFRTLYGRDSLSEFSLNGLVILLDFVDVQIFYFRFFFALSTVIGLNDIRTGYLVKFMQVAT